MVSLLCLIAVSFMAAQVSPGVVSQSTPAASFRDEPKPAPATAAPPQKPIISPEMRGDILMARKMYREAAEAYKEGPKDSAVLLNKTGIAYHQMLELAAAEKYYRLATRVNREYPEAINNLGTVYYARKGYRRAIGEYKKALRINPKSASIWSNLGMGYFARKEYVRAQESWQQAMALDPDVFENHGTQGVLLQERSVEERAKFHYFLAEGYAKKGQNDRALLYIRKALEEGFKDRKKLQEDPAFAALQDLPEFKQLMAMEPRVL
ncbi:MAG TPA: tetratricopeptide repeat protein [Bryobacteraceae bacterium]|jgi:tetratricopeptide (TPR) repeat protein|nr:tetratricopeptide repeat protein [Bryobacteraceae bacterium]